MGHNRRRKTHSLRWCKVIRQERYQQHHLAQKQIDSWCNHQFDCVQLWQAKENKAEKLISQRFLSNFLPEMQQYQYLDFQLIVKIFPTFGKWAHDIFRIRHFEHNSNSHYTSWFNQIQITHLFFSHSTGQLTQVVKLKTVKFGEIQLACIEKVQLS